MRRMEGDTVDCGGNRRRDYGLIGEWKETLWIVRRMEGDTVDCGGNRRRDYGLIWEWKEILWIVRGMEGLRYCGL